MPQAARKITPTLSRIEEAIAYLSHVQDGTGRHGGRDYWRIGETIQDNIEQQRVLANSSLDGDLGRVLAANFIAVLNRFPDQASVLMSETIKSMIWHGRLSAVEFAFIDALSRSVKVSVFPIAVVAAEQRVAAMHKALHA